MNRFLIVLAALLLGAGWGVCAPSGIADGKNGSASEAIGFSEKQVGFFESHIRPVLISECVECHGAQKQKGGLRLDWRGGWQKGGDSGPAIIPQKPDESLLLRSIRHEDPDLKMPEKAPKLDDAVIRRFSEWIAMGAPDPRAELAIAGEGAKSAWPDLLAARRSWWALQPVKKQTSPRGAAAAHPVDGFLNEALAKAGIPGNAPAAPGVLVRRLHFLLTGLPPSPDDVRSFAMACGENGVGQGSAVRERATRLLNEPSFGEHWARHWMDLVRYAESHGSEGDPEIPGAYHYRNYLIRAFQQDVPLDQLIREHLAGDLLPKPRVSAEGLNESRIGLAHFRMVDHGFQPVDTLDDQLKAVDNQIDVVTKAFQGLTVSCARCHDHKFDAISQRDYTALYGIFASVRPGQLAADSEKRLGMERQEFLQMLKQEIRGEMASQWLKTVQRFPAAMEQLVRPTEGKEQTELRARLARLSEELASKEWARISGERERAGAAPYAVWNFGLGAQDLLGRMTSELKGGAEVKDGALVLSGKGAYLQTSALPRSIGERTLECWLTLDQAGQRGGGVFGIESVSDHAFDTIVFAEKSPKKWLPGSNNFKRTEQPEGDEEESDFNQRVHVAIVYQPDGTIAVYRNGFPYGKAYRKDELQTYAAGKARLLIGLRHTGAGNGFFQGRIHEARLYDRALSAAEVAVSFRAGTLVVAEKRPSSQAVAEQDTALTGLRKEVEKLRAAFVSSSAADAGDSALERASKPEHVMHLAVKAASMDAKAFSKYAASYRERMEAKFDEDRRFNQSGGFEDAWNLKEKGGAGWFTQGPDLRWIECGDFRVSPNGGRIFERLLPSGMAASSLFSKAGYGGLLSSPEFILRSKSMSVKVFGSDGAMVRVIPDNYPLGSNGSIFAKAVFDRASPDWLRLDTSYRVGSSAYVEFTTPGFQTRAAAPEKDKAVVNPEKASFVVEKVVFHEGKEAPRLERLGLEWILGRLTSTERESVLREFGSCLKEAVSAWSTGATNESQRQVIDAAMDIGILDTSSDLTPVLAAKVAAYRSELNAVPAPTMVPAVYEHQAFDAVFRKRGDHKSPGDPVPRGYLEVFGAEGFVKGMQSGRLELAEQLFSKSNPLTARVMANRIWYWIMGSGIVPTLDNFGRMGERPSHPELLDFLASQLQEGEWSLKRMILFLVETDAFQRASTPSEMALEKDPGNALLSHAHVRRLEAESIRDALLAVSGALDTTQFGASVPVAAPRRSVYLVQKRNSLPPLLTTFDAPKPFTTLGRRDVTTVPAQSLTLLNDPAILEMAARWAQLVTNEHPTFELRVDAMFWRALGRAPSTEEVAAARALLESNGSVENLQPLAHALFNLKEFIYLR